MEPAEIKALLASWTERGDDKKPIFLSRSDLKHLEVADFANGAKVQVMPLKGNVQGYITKGTTTPLQLEVREKYERKFWSAPVGMSHYLDLVRRAIETRQRIREDVVPGAFDDSDAPCVRFNYSIHLSKSSVSKAYAEGLKVNEQLFEVAQATKLAVGDLLVKTAQKLSGWGESPLEELIDQVEVQKTTDLKGRVLEELACRLFATIPGFEVKGRVRTETEEIDIRIINKSSDPFWKKESQIIIAECKNWSSSVGVNEFSSFEKKVSSRWQRCKCGFLISWNGFAETIHKELLRGSRENPLIILVSGEDLRAAVFNGSFGDAAQKLWEQAIFQ